MSSPGRWMVRAVFAMCVTILVVAALGELTHDHALCALETSATCSSCVLAVAIVVLPATLSLPVPVAQHRFCWADAHQLLPAGAPLGPTDARAPPAC